MNPRLAAIALVLGSLCVPVCYGLNSLPRVVQSLVALPSWVWPVLVSPVTEEFCKAFAFLSFWSVASGEVTVLKPRNWLVLGLFLGMSFGLTEASLNLYLHSWTRVDLIVRGIVVVFIHGIPVAVVGLLTALYRWRGWVIALAIAVVWHGLWNASLVFSSRSGMMTPVGLAMLFALLGTGVFVFVLPLFLPGSIFRPNRDVRKFDE